MAKSKPDAAPAEASVSTEPAIALARARPTVHLILQAKGGAGKSVVASFLAQWLTNRALRADEDDGFQVPMCLDTDPLNQTFTAYNGQGFTVDHIQIVEEDGVSINSARFDDLMERILTMDMNAPRDVVIDTGSSNFLQLIDYVKRCHIPSELDNAGFRLVVHTVVAGGGSLRETLQSIDSITDNLAAWRPLTIVVWENPYYGPIQTEKWKDFKESQTYSDNSPDIRTIIKIPTLHSQLEGHDLALVLKRNHTLDAAIGEPTYSTMSRKRLIRLQSKLWETIREGFEQIAEQSA